MLAKRIIFLISGFATFVALTVLLVTSVKHEPEGIPKPLLPKYKAKLASVRAAQELAAQVGQEVHPRVEILETKFEFGMLDPHTTATHTFDVRNVGDAPLQLEVLETTCKCTAGSVSNGKIFPGGSGKVTLTWNTGYQAEHYEQTARVRTNDPLRPTIDLTVSGRIKAELITPPSVQFGSINPGESSNTKFQIYSQLWDEFVVEDITTDLPGFTWYAEPLDVDDVSLMDKDARWAWNVEVSTTGGKRGSFQDNIVIELVSPISGERMTRTIVAGGKVRAPINFYSPDIHARTGLELGTLHNDEEHQFNLLVRPRGPIRHHIEVLDVEPKQFTATLQAIEGTEDQFRLVLVIPKGCESVIFNRDNQQGYVEVGDPDDRDYRNWFPIHGAVVEISDF